MYLLEMYIMNYRTKLSIRLSLGMVSNQLPVLKAISYLLPYWVHIPKACNSPHQRYWREPAGVRGDSAMSEEAQPGGGNRPPDNPAHHSHRNSVVRIQLRWLVLHSSLVLWKSKDIWTLISQLPSGIDDRNKKMFLTLCDLDLCESLVLMLAIYAPKNKVLDRWKG